MKQIKEYKEINGKTILNAVKIPTGDGVIIVFDDDTFFSVQAIERHGDISLDTYSKVSDYEKKEAGIITIDEFNAIESQNNSKLLGVQKYKELAELRRLTDKYGALGSVEHDSVVIIEGDL